MLGLLKRISSALLPPILGAIALELQKLIVRSPSK